MTITDRHSRLLRTEAEIFAAGREVGRTLPPLTEEQVTICARILAPLYDATAKGEQR